jgi:acyl-CoA thioesterase I
MDSDRNSDIMSDIYAGIDLYKDRKQTRFLKRTLADLQNGCNVTIVTFGDSITAGYAVRRGFPSFWKEMLQQKYPDARIEMINSGVSGDTTMDGLARLDWSVLSYEPDLVTINFGINDCVMGLGLEEFEANFVEIMRRIHAGPDSEILLLSSQPLETPPYDRMVLDYYQAIGRVAREMDVGFVDVYRAWMHRVRQGTPLGSMIITGMDHPNEAGYKVIAEELMRIF